MKGNAKVLALLNARLTDELTSVHQNISLSGLLSVQGYGGLADTFWSHSRSDMHHAERLIARIGFLEGKPVRNTNPIASASEVEEMLKANLKLSLALVDGYNETIGVCLEVGDHGSRQLSEGLLMEAEGRVQWLEGQMNQLKAMGADAYMGAIGCAPSAPSTH